MSARAWLGTSGYSFDEWKGNFYPEKLPSKEMLHFYAQRLETVEINNTFYRMPTESLVNGWLDQVPEGFRFAIKSPQRITHMRRLKECAESVTRLVQGMAGSVGIVIARAIVRDLSGGAVAARHMAQD